MSTDPDSPVVDDGIVAEFADEEYLYGFGLLRLRISRVTLLRSDPEWRWSTGSTSTTAAMPTSGEPSW
jgi:hypothetical protein